MKSWSDFSAEQPELAEHGRKMLLRSRERVGLAFIATLRKDGAPRLHPISLILSQGHAYVIIPRASPKCADLLRDGRYALQASPPPNNEESEEFYFSGCAAQIHDPIVQQMLMDDTGITVEENELLFELFPERAMYTKLLNRGAPDEHPIHYKWRASSVSQG
jgi:hypothetical protein